MDRDCNKCVYHTNGSCSQWECKGTTRMTEVKYNIFGGELIVKYDEKGITMITREAFEALLETKKSYAEYAEVRYQQGRVDREKELAELPNEYSEKLWKNAYNRGRAEAIDEFAEKIKEYSESHFIDCDPYWGTPETAFRTEIFLDDIVEELKGGAECKE